MGWGLAVCLWLGPPWFSCWFSFTLPYSGIGRGCSSLFIVVINFVFVFSLWCTCWVGGLCAGRVFVYFCIGVALGPGVELAGCEGALSRPSRPPPPPATSPGGLLCRPFWGGGPGVGFALCCFVVCSAGRLVVCLSVCRFVLVFFGPFGVAVASLGEGGGGSGLGAFRAFVGSITLNTGHTGSAMFYNFWTEVSVAV